MAFFEYKALDQGGGAVSGKIASSSQEEAVRELRTRNLSVFDIRIAANRRAGRGDGVAPSQSEYLRIIQQIGVLVKSGVSILDAVDSLRRNAPRRRMRDQLGLIAADLRQGAAFSEAVGRHMPVLPAYAAPLFRMAEATGQLAPVATMIADQMKRAETIRKSVRDALNYPLFLLCVGIAAVGFIFYFVVPRFSGMVAGHEDKLPMFSRLLFAAGIGFQDNAVIIVPIIGGVVALAIVLFRQAGVRSWFADVSHLLPVLGPWSRMVEQGTWLRVMGLATHAGSRLLEALELAAAAAAPRSRRHLYDEVRQSVRGGMNLGDAVGLSLDLDPMAMNLINTGLKSSQLPAMLLAAAETYDEEIEAYSKRVTTLAEPIAILTISAIIGSVVISLVTAMTSIYDVAF
jgi:type II secretory pathway component PulF